MYWTYNSMNNLLSFCGLVDAKIRASDKDLPVNVNFGRLKSNSLISLINVETCLLILIFFPPSTVIDFLDFFHPHLLIYCSCVLFFSKKSHPSSLCQPPCSFFKLTKKAKEFVNWFHSFDVNWDLDAHFWKLKQTPKIRTNVLAHKSF